MAISAGIAQYKPSSIKPRTLSSSKPSPMHSGPLHLHNVDHAKAPNLSSIYEPEDHNGPFTEISQIRRKGASVSKLRIDAFLGEWLSPDYYESITPPPSSVMMLAGAKADLRRRATYMDPSQEHTRSISHQGNFPGGWGNGSMGPAAESGSEDDSPLSRMSSLARALPQRDRASSHGTAARPGRPIHRVMSKVDTSPSSGQGVYIAPIPSYAISPSSPIPLGYVAHARDACVDVDYQWDSMTPPFNWGDGGEYGEEWSSMHKRFRKGLHDMIMWYREPRLSETDGDGIHDFQKLRDGKVEDDSDDDVDTVLILVTHGAGCNALIGALTNQPVLIDVGMASLTMAVRRDASDGTTSSTDRPPVESGISDEYEVCLVASTEHLRPITHPIGISPIHHSPRIPFQPSPAHRHRISSSASSTNSPVDGGFSLPEPATRAMASVGMGGGLSRSASNASTSSTGLWSKPALQSDPGVPGNVDTTAEMPEEHDTGKDAEKDTIEPMHKVPIQTRSQRGLWGEASQAITNEREPGIKRRWTVNEHH